MRNSAYTVACLGVVGVLCAQPGELWAQAVRVTITSEPSGATVWVDDRSGKALGTTPYNTSLSEGKHTVFLELPGYEFVVQEINVRRRKRGPQRVSFNLVQLRSGSIDVLAASGSPDADGARVFIDGKEVGTVPDTFDIPEGAHQVEVVKDGYKRFQNWVEVTKGESVEVSVALEALRPGETIQTSRDPDPNPDSPITSRPSDDGKGKATVKDGPSPVVLAAGMGAGWRRFDYEQPRTNNLRPYSANGIALVDIGAEFRVGALVSALRWLSIFGGASLSLPLTSSTEAGAEEIKTSWFRREVGLRARFDAGPGAFGLDVAEGGNAFTFDNAGLLENEIPEAVYEYVRMGATYGVHKGDNAFGAGGDGLVILSSNGVSDRFNNPSIVGFRVHGWYRRHLFSGVQASLTGSFTQFSYALEAGPLHDADGGYDRMFDVILSGGYSF
jgi:hypothetical protein